MPHPSLRAPRAGLAVLLALAAFAIASCDKKPVALVDPSLAPPVYPEGRPANTSLVTYPDTPVPVQLWQDNGEPGETPDDQLLSTSFVYESGPGAVVGMIIDSTDASQYQVYKRHADGGYVDLFSYTLKPIKTWPTTSYDSYQFTDPHPYAPPTREYIGRGVVDGIVTAQAPLTNLSDLTQFNEPGLLKYTGAAEPATTDSLVPFKWQAVPGAAGYWLSMYAFPPAYLPGAQLFHNALPHPLMTERIPEYFVAWIPAPTTSYTLYDPLPAGSHLLSSGREIVVDNDYAVRIVAVDANGQMLDYTGSTGAYITIGAADGEYYRLPIGAVLVRPVPPPPPPPGLVAGTAAPARLEHRLRPGEVRVSTIPGPRR